MDLTPEKPTTLPSYQARLLSGATPRSGSLSRSDSNRHSILSLSSKGTLGRSDSLEGSALSPTAPDSLSRTSSSTSSSRWNGGRGHGGAGSRSVDATRGFWQERVKAAESEAGGDGGASDDGMSSTTTTMTDQRLRKLSSTGSSSSDRGRESVDPLDPRALASFPSGSSFASTNSNGTGPTYSPPPDSHFAGSTASPTPLSSGLSSRTSFSKGSTRTHRRANSATPFTFQPSSSSSASSPGSGSTAAFPGSLNSPFLRPQTTGDRAHATPPSMERSRTYDSPSSVQQTPPASLSRASSITSRFAGRPLSASYVSFPSSNDPSSPTTPSSSQIDPPAFKSSYLKERHARLLSTGSSSSSSAPSSNSNEEQPRPTATSLTHQTPIPTFRRTPSSPDPSSSAPSSTTPISASAPLIPSIREPLGPRRGPAARLGRHMPRIASGDGGGMDEDEDERSRPTSQASTVGRTHGRNNSLSVASPSRLVAGFGLGGDGSMGRGVQNIAQGDEVVGMKGRRRLPLTSSSLNISANAVPSLRLSTATIERTRKEIIAEEYLTHVGEALQWVEGVLQKDLLFGVVEFEEKLRDGVVLARLAEGLGARGGDRIFEHPKLQWRHSDNIIMFLKFIKSPEVGLPDNFIFETIDLYEKKNLPKVIFCIHSLSHLLANRGLMERIGNLTGKLAFSEEQLQAASKNLGGQAMPNFKSIGKDLAREMNIEPPPESEEDRRDRLLLEAKTSIIALQSHAVGRLARLDYQQFLAELHDVSPSVIPFQAVLRAVLAGQQLAKARSARDEKLQPLSGVYSAFQDVARGALARANFRSNRTRLARHDDAISRFQCHVRGMLERDRFDALQEALAPHEDAISRLQCHVRGMLERDRFDALRDELAEHEEIFEDFGAHARAALVRRRNVSKKASIATSHEAITRFAAVARSALVRKEFKSIQASLLTASPGLVGFQSRVKANVVRRNHQQLAAALANVQTITSAVGAQSFFRAALSRARKGEQKKEVEFVLPNFVGFQAMARRAYQKGEYEWWSEHLRSNQLVATHLQSLFRGAMVRREFYGRLDHFHRNIQAIIRLQAIRRGKGPREGFNGIRLGKNVKVSTIKNFGHLLDDTDAQFAEEEKLKKLRHDVVETFRTTQVLETDIEDLDQNIGLFAQNIASFQGRNRHEPSSSSSTSFVDPFSTSSLSREAAHKLDLYQQLFYHLQTNVHLLANLCSRLPENASDPTRKLVEDVVLHLYGYGQGRREEYWAMMFFQSAVAYQINAAPSYDAILQAFFPFAKIAVRYIQPKDGSYIQDVVGPLVLELVNDPNLNLDIDAGNIYEAFRQEEAMRTGRPVGPGKEISHREGLTHEPSRQECIARLQIIRSLSVKFIKTLMASTARMPYSIRWIARELLAASRRKYPDISDEHVARIIGRFIFQRYLKPAILLPDNCGILTSTVSPQARLNLRQIAALMDQVALGVIFDGDSSMSPLNQYVEREGSTFQNWFRELADVADVKEHLGVDEFVDVTAEPLPVSISPTEVYAIHKILQQEIDEIDLSGQDKIRNLLQELGGPPLPADASGREKPIALKLINRSAPLEDPEAAEKAEWARAKRLILAVLRVQPDRDIMSALLAPVEDEHLELWASIAQLESHGLPPLPGQEATYNLNDIKNLPYDEIKVQALTACMELEQKAVVSRLDGFQSILNSIAYDIRTKNRKQIQRSREIQSMSSTLERLQKKKKGLQEQIEMYHAHNAESISKLQGRGKRSSVIPLGKQYWHRRSLQQHGQMPQYGSWVYEAKSLYARGLLLSIEQYSPTQFERLEIVLSSNEAGIFIVEILIIPPGQSKTSVCKATIAMQDLLVRQRDRKESVALGAAEFNVNKLVAQLNKKFYKN